METRRNAFRDLEEYSSIRRILPLSIAGRVKSERILSPHREGLKEIIELARIDIDREIRAMYKEDPRPRVYRLASPSAYPTGHCEMIRDKMMERLLGMVNSEVDRKLPEIQAIGRAALADLPIGKVHGIIDYGTGRCFQNAIQVGHLILDSAMDTISDKRKKVEVYDVDSGVLRNIDDYFEYADIVKRYWGMTVSSTAAYLPNLAVLFPLMITNRANGRVDLAKYHSLFFGNIRQDFRLSEEIAEKGEFDPLPPAILQKLRAKYRKGEGWFEWQENKTQLAQMFSHHRRKFHPLLNGADEKTKRDLLEKVVQVYENIHLDN